MEYEITDVLSFLKELQQLREHEKKLRENDEDEAGGMVPLIKQLGAERKQAFDREAHRVNRDAYGAGAKTGAVDTGGIDDERERLNVQYWTETVPMVSDYNKEHGTDIKPWKCVQLNGEELRKGHPYFHQKVRGAKRYRIAVAIVYDEATKNHKPVHVGDPIRLKGSPRPVNWAFFNTWKSHVRHLSKDWTWAPPAPKREFEINGEKFACPEKGTCSGQYVLGVNGVVFGFKDSEERDRVQNTITKLLTDAANK